MNSITILIKRFLKDEVKVLGRWNINYCNKSMNYKIDLSNEDHCGPCGQYALIKSKETKKIHLPNSKEYKSNE